MIFSIIFLIAGAWLAFNFYQRNYSAFVNRQTPPETKTKLLAKFVGLLVLTFSLTFFPPISGELINAGHVGVRFNKWGSDKGVSKYSYASGYVVYLPIMTDVKEFSTAYRSIEYPASTVLTKGGSPAYIHVTFNYKPIAANAGDMYVSLRQELVQIEQQWLKTTLLGVIQDVSNSWALDSILNHRGTFDQAIVIECNKRVSRWFEIDGLKTNFTPDKAILNAINRKTEALQQSQVEENLALAAINKMNKMIIEAKADSADRVIRAAGQAEEIRRLMIHLSPVYNDYLRAQRWNGVNPTTVLGSESKTIVQLPK